ncbi:MAG: preprotein translocase subunit YajC [Acidimicrobiia bacterium]
MTVSIIFFALVLAAFFFFIVLPQRRRSLVRQQYLSGLEVGDAVITNGGIFGTIVTMDDEAVDLQVADGIVLHVARAAIFQDVPPPPAESGPDDDDDDADASGDTGDVEA